MRKNSLGLAAAIALTAFGVGTAAAEPPQVVVIPSVSPIAVGGGGQGGTTALQVRIYNPSASSAATVGFSLPYPAGLANASSPNSFTTCGGTVTAAGGGGSLSLSGGNIAAWGTCVVGVDLVGSAVGSQTLSLSPGAVSASTGSNSSVASATVDVVPASGLIVQKYFSGWPGQVGFNLSMQLQIWNRDPSLAATSINIVDNYPAGLVNSDGGSSNGCGGVLNTPAGGASFTLVGGTLNAGATCVININVGNTLSGVLVNSIPASNISSSLGSPAAATTALLPVNPSPLVVTNTKDGGTNSLRDALGYVNSNCPAEAVVEFQIPGTGPHTISPTSQLPPVVCPAAIDASTQPGFTGGPVSGRGIKVILNGGSCTACDGLELNASGTSVIGMAIHSFQAAGIRVNASGSVYIESNYIGTDPGGVNSGPGNAVGVEVAGGTAELGSAGDVTRANLITANSIAGVFVVEPLAALREKSASTPIVQAYLNQIGGDRAGNGGLGNGGPGVYFENAQPSFFSSYFEENHIRSNNGPGIRSDLGHYVHLHANKIHDNNGYTALDLGGNGPTPNDGDESDGIVNKPQIMSVTYEVTETGTCSIPPCTHVTAKVQSVYPGSPSNTVRFDFFSNQPAPSVPEGSFYMGFANSTLDLTGQATVTQTFAGIMAQNITATASYASCFAECPSRTSEYSETLPLAPTVSTSFSSSTAFVGNTVKLNIATTNTNTGMEISGFSFTFTAPANLKVLTALPLNDCVSSGGYSNTSTTATFSGPSIPAGGTCTFEVTLVPEAVAVYTYAAGTLTVSSSLGSATNSNSTTLSASLQSPSFGFSGMGTITTGVPVALGIFVSRTASDPTYSGIGFTLNLPAGVTVASTPNIVPGCSGGSVTASPGGSTITVSGKQITINGACELFRVDVVFATAGSHTFALPSNSISFIPGSATNPFLLSTPVSTTVTANAPAVTSVSVAPSPISFGNVVVGSNSMLTATLTNTGNTNVSVGTIGATGSSVFTLPSPPNPCPSPLLPGNTCQIVVQFSPTAATAYSGTLSFTSTAPGSPHTVSLMGTGVAPGLNPSVSSVAFGNQTINTTSAAQTVTVSNTGTSNLTITVITIDGDFSFSGCATPISLVPGASCTLSVTFFPTTTGPLSGSISISSDASGSPHLVSLSGTGTPVPMPAIALAPSSASFSANVGASASHVFALSNTGNANLAISGISIGAPSPAASRAKVASFTQANDCPASLAPSAACNITVTYAPTAPGTESAELQVFSNAVPSPMVAALSGTATLATTAAVSLSASSVDFPPQFMGIPSAAQTVMLTNTGTGPLEISNIATSGDFGYSGCGFPITLASGASCSFAITFRPLTEGPHAGSIAITSNASGSPHAISLSGTGVALTAPQISLSPSSLGFGTVRIARTVTLVQRLTNVGAAPLSISSIAATGAFFSQSHNCATTLAVAAACDISVTYAPTATGPHSGQVVIHSNAIPSPHIAALSGTGQAIPPPFLDVDEAVVFGGQVVGTTTRRTLTLGNGGGEPLRISALQIFGAGAAAFGVEGACETIAPGATCDIAVTFVPTELADFAARLDIVSNHSGGVQQVALSGSGIPTPRPELAVSVGGLGFGNQAVGTTGETRSFTLTSVGQVGARVFGFEAPPDYQVNAGECPATLAPQASCQVHVTFRPIASGARVGRITIASDGASSPNSVSVTGVGCRFFSLGAGRNPARLCAP